MKRGDSSSVNSSRNMQPGQYSVDNVPLVDVVSAGFDIPGSRIEGPGWIFGDRFTVTARISPGASNAERPLMIRALLLDRFKLRYHIVKRDGDGYELRLARADGQLGPQLRRSTSAARLGGRITNRLAPDAGTTRDRGFSKPMGSPRASLPPIWVHNSMPWSLIEPG